MRRLYYLTQIRLVRFRVQAVLLILAVPRFDFLKNEKGKKVCWAQLGIVQKY